MSTVTAQILVGHPDIYHGGIWPTHGLYLFENSRPSWVLVPLGLQLPAGPAERLYTWLPGPDRILEDGMLMIYLYALKDEGERGALLTFVVVGGGPTGVELAGALAEIARHTLPGEFRSFDPVTARVILVEGAPRVLPPYPEKLSASAQAQLQHLGVEVRTGAMLEEIVPGKGVRIRAGPDGRHHRLFGTIVERVLPVVQGEARAGLAGREA